MLTHSILIAVLVLCCNVLPHDACAQRMLSDRIVHYTIDVALEPSKKMLIGKEILIWKNPSDDTVRELRFHLYLNAFKNQRSTFMKESDGESRGFELTDGEWGWIDISSIKLHAVELKKSMEFIQPDDGNKDDSTVMRIVLPKPVLPQETITMEIQFIARLPRAFARTGYYQNFFLVGQWFPKIGVYEIAGQRYATKGEWNCHQFHEHTEFYANFGVYEVNITVPKNFVVGATGTLVKRTETRGGFAQHSYHAEDVHDFAWTASPDYLVIDDRWKHVAIRLLMQPQREYLADRYLASVKSALAYYERLLGVYPYHILTLVDPANGAMGAGGMEYPTFITLGTLWGIGSWLRFQEIVTVHEFGHQYWYGMLASNEFEEAWLDEGINQYIETRIMDDVYGKNISVLDLFGFHIGDFAYTREGYAGTSDPALAPTYQPAWKYTRGYGVFTYDKPAVLLTTLERMIGRSVMDEILRTYFDRWKFKHPCTRDFIAIVNEVVRLRHGIRFGENMNWFFDQTLFGKQVCDFELTSITNRWSDSTSMYESRVQISQLRDMRLPVEVRIEFEDGSVRHEHWTGNGKSKTFIYRGDKQVRSALIDPENKLPLDINMVNNSKTIATDAIPLIKYTSKFLFWIQSVFQFLLMFA